VLAPERHRWRSTALAVVATVATAALAIVTGRAAWAAVATAALALCLIARAELRAAARGDTRGGLLIAAAYPGEWAAIAKLVAAAPREEPLFVLAVELADARSASVEDFEHSNRVQRDLHVKLGRALAAIGKHRPRRVTLLAAVSSDLAQATLEVARRLAVAELVVIGSAGVALREQRAHAEAAWRALRGRRRALRVQLADAAEPGGDREIFELTEA
jgi:hypothetical protein